MSNVTPGVATKDLQPGKKYKIDIEDCCVDAQLIGTFLEFQGDPDDPVLTFDIGTFEMYTQVIFEPAE